jgi:hypothetical protein
VTCESINITTDSLHLFRVFDKTITAQMKSQRHQAARKTLGNLRNDKNRRIIIPIMIYPTIPLNTELKLVRQSL